MFHSFSIPDKVIMFGCLLFVSSPLNSLSLSPQISVLPTAEEGCSGGQDPMLARTSCTFSKPGSAR